MLVCRAGLLRLAVPTAVGPRAVPTRSYPSRSARSTCAAGPPSALLDPRRAPPGAWPPSLRTRMALHEPGGVSRGPLGRGAAGEVILPTSVLNSCWLCRLLAGLMVGEQPMEPRRPASSGQQLGGEL